MSALTDAIATLAETPLPTRLGTVVSTSPFRVSFYDTATHVSLPRLGSYTPVLNDVVLTVGPERIVLGKVIPADGAQAQTVTARSY